MGIIIIIIVLVVIGSLFSEGSPTKTTRRYKDFWGNWRTETKYHDTGKRVKTMTRKGFWGDRVTNTYVDKPLKTCFRCKTSVSADSDGFYCCSCGKTFR